MKTAVAFAVAVAFLAGLAVCQEIYSDPAVEEQSIIVGPESYLRVYDSTGREVLYWQHYGSGDAEVIVTRVIQSVNAPDPFGQPIFPSP